MLVIALVGLAVIYFKDKGYRPFFIVMLVLILRIGFNWFMMPIRQEKDYGTKAKNQAAAIGQKYKDVKLELYKNAKLDHTSSFYIARERGVINYRNRDPGEDDIYLIVDTSRTEIPVDYEVVDTFRKREDWTLMYVVKRK